MLTSFVSHAPSSREDLLSTLRSKAQEFERLNALASPAVIITDVVALMQHYFEATDAATTDLAGALAHSHASKRTLRRWVQEGSVRKVGDQYVIATLPVLSVPSREHATRAVQPRADYDAAAAAALREARRRAPITHRGA